MKNGGGRNKKPSTFFCCKWGFGIRLHSRTDKEWSEHALHLSLKHRGTFHRILRSRNRLQRRSMVYFNFNGRGGGYNATHIENGIKRFLYAHIAYPWHFLEKFSVSRVLGQFFYTILYRLRDSNLHHPSSSTFNSLPLTPPTPPPVPPFEIFEFYFTGVSATKS